MVVWLASYPRSGNTFFRILIHHIYGVKTYSEYNDPLFDRIGASDDIGHEKLPAPLTELTKSKSLFLVKTHDKPVDDSPAIYLVRDGRDAVVSFARYMRSFVHPRWSWRRKLGLLLRKSLGQDLFTYALRQVITDSRLYGGWGGNVMAWIRRPQGSQVIIRYEDLIANPTSVLDRAIGSLGLNLTKASESAPSFEELHAKWPQFFRKGKVGSWREEMPEPLQKLFWEKHGEAMRELGYI